MKLIIGGANQNKCACCLKKYNLSDEEVANGEDISCEKVPTQQVLNHLHLWIKRLLDEGKAPEIFVKNYCKQNPNAIILCDEIGCGIVPVEYSDRLWREEVGRICCWLAKNSDSVERIFCGISTNILV